MNERVKLLLFIYRVCQGLWPSLRFADENIELKNFRALSKSQVATTYLCMHFCSNCIGWSNHGKYYEIEMHCAKPDVATWLYDEANIFRFNMFVWKHRPTGLATQVTIPDTHGIIIKIWGSLTQKKLSFNFANNSDQ